MADFPRIVVLGFNGEEALRYLRLADNYYYGGTTHDDYRKTLPEYGPHVYRPLSGMLDLIAAIANLGGDSRLCYQLQGTGGGQFESEPISREMHADRIARILGCDEKDVREHYDRLVLIPEANSG